ncbi:MAG: HDIG domain-containing protein [Proteobacteria bacterium]|nr:HDIG domain-containing protein [Pseudomonadota bacterium]
MVCAATAVLLTEFRRVPDTQLTVGQVSSRDIRAPVKFEFVDEVATQALVEAAVEAVPSVYDHDGTLLPRQQTRISSAFEVAREELELRQMQRDSEPLDDEAIAAVREVFVAQLGMTLKDEDLHAIAAAEYSKAMEQNAIELLTHGMTRYVVNDRGELPDATPITVVRLVGDERDEGLLTSLGEISTVDAARQAITMQVLERYSDPDAERARAASGIARAAVRSNFTFNQLHTEERRLEAGQGVSPVILSIDRGTTLVRNGDVATAHQIAIIAQMQETTTGRNPWSVAGSLFAFSLLLLTSVYWFAAATIKKFSNRRRDVEALGLLLVFTVLLARLVVEVGDPVAAAGTIGVSARAIWYLVPVAGSALLVRILINSETAIVFAVVSSILCGLLMEQSATYTAFFMVSSVVAAGTIGRKRERSAILRAGVFTGLFNAAFVVVISLVNANLADTAGGASALSPGWDAVFAFSGGVIGAFLVLGLVPLFELVGFDTDLKLLELGNLDHPLLRNLMLRAPGSYHHSVMVGTLAEAAAEAIGANALLCRVCSYFHDIGKAVRPAYFVENQRDGQSRHDRLSPHQSARVIIDHVRDGGKVAKKHGLPRPVIDQIYMHHGTGLVHYFYAKSKAADPNTDANDFRYPGPRPNTREAGVIMLADKIEAACRSIKEPNPENVSAMIQRIINSVISEGQFDECPMTVKEITVVADVFKKTVLAIHHHRIEYPEPAGQLADGVDPEETEAVDEPVITLEIPATTEAIPETSHDAPLEGPVDYESPEYMPGYRDP